jgi:hypothetical protein
VGGQRTVKNKVREEDKTEEEEYAQRDWKRNKPECN